MTKIYLKTFVFLGLILSILCFGPAFAQDEENQVQTYNGAFWTSPIHNQFNPVKNQAAAQQTENLPAQYDLRNIDGKSYVSPVKNQAYFGTCWAHGAISTAETSALLKGADSKVDLSEKALAWYAYKLQNGKNAPEEDVEGSEPIDFDLSWNYEPESRVYDSGGSILTIMAQMCTWNGASTEEDIPYVNANRDYYALTNGSAMASPEGDWTIPYENAFQNAYHMQNAKSLLVSSYDEEDVMQFTNEAKSLMLKDGALVLGYAGEQHAPYFNEETAAQYVSKDTLMNHLVSIVGWDDSFPASNFIEQPPADGAWIVKNSWGTSFGDQGFFYLSYYDHSIAYVLSLDVETAQTGFSYDKNYEYDYLGLKNNYQSDISENFIADNGINGLNPGSLKMANVFTTSSDETLKAVSFSPVLNSSCDVTAKVYILNDNYQNPEDGQPVATVSGSVSTLGFYTLPLESPVPLPKNTTYSVVEETTYTVTNETGQEETFPYFSLEFGLQEPVEDDLIDQQGNQVGICLHVNQATIHPNESYLYGLNGTIGTTPPAWEDVTSPDLYNKLSVDYTTTNPQGVSTPNKVIPGNVMIKAFTTYGTGETNFPDHIELNSKKVYLTTSDSGTNVSYLVPVISPSNTTTNYTWTITPSDIARVDIIENNAAKITALNEGEATITCTTDNELVATCSLTVNNDPLICSGADYIRYSPDYFNVVLRDVIPNPAYKNGIPATSVSVFCFSAENQSDINAKLALKIPATNDWVCERLPVNDTAVNNYFDNADDIQIHAYASNIPNSTGEILVENTYSWITPSTVGENSVGYITYCQNVGFVHPTVWSGATSGEIDDPDSTHMEGFRISSGIMGIEISSEAYVEGKGWLPAVGDGTYCGTMGENRAIQAIRLNVNGAIAPLGVLSYRVYLKDSGWTEWTDAGEICGLPDSGTVQAMEVNLVPVDIEF